MEAATTTQDTPPVEGVSSFAKSLFLGEIHEELVFPFPKPDDAEQERIRALCTATREVAAEMIDPRRVEEERWIGDEVIAALGEAGVMGLYVPEEYGGQGLSQTGYCRVSEVFAQIDPVLSVILGVHQSIGMKGIVLFGSDEQKARHLPDLAAGRKLAGFALTEPEAGSDVHGMHTRAERQADGSWRLDGMKHYIGNGDKGSVFVTFAATEHDGERRHTAFIVEKGMDGFEVGKRFDTMGLRGNDLRELHFNGVLVPPENVLGEPGEGFRIAMHVLNNGRMSLGTGSVGGAKFLLDRTIDHVKERKQFGRPLADFELVQDKIGWMVSYLFGLESTAYLTCGLVDMGVPDYSLESAMVKVSGTEFLWYAANRCLQLKGGAGYMRDEPYEKILRDTRIFPIFEGANDVMRAFIALSAMKPVGDRLKELGGLNLSDPVGSIGVLAEYVTGRVQREVRPDRITRGHEALKPLTDPLTDQVKRLASVTESLLREHKGEVINRQFQQKRLADAGADIYAQIALLSRTTAIFEEHGVEPSGQERYIAETFCSRAAGRVNACLDQVEHNDDERMVAIAKLACRRGEYGYAFFED
ncbi:MAG TPA: acyl-CoA dehydrogenase family protein [Thermoleophilaceae bacterium]|nr:acyl-CoA dehydrogenase family protein [Thermoleophilaceae bacterium]